MIDSISERSLPFARDAEQCVLGSIILENLALREALVYVEPEDFYFEQHKIIYDACRALYVRGTGIDLITLKHYLTEQEELEMIGGVSYLDELIQVVPTARNIVHYSKIVRAKAQSRRLIIGLSECLNKAYDDDKHSLDTAVRNLEKNIEDFRHNTSEASSQSLFEIAVSAGDFIAKDIPERDPLIDGVMFTSSVNMGYSWRGLGKSQLFAGSLAAEVSTGGEWLYWNVPDPARVLYVDGELPGKYLQWIFQNWLAGRDGSMIDIIASDTFFEKYGRSMDLNRKQDQELLLDSLIRLEADGRRPELIILDNLSTLFWEQEDKHSDQDTLLQFVMHLRHMKYAVFVVDHAGKSKEARGSRGHSRKEDPLDLVIKLDEPEAPSLNGAAKFRFEITKFRGLWPKPGRFECEMVRNENLPGFWKWRTESIGDTSMPIRILNHIYKFKPNYQADIAEAFGVKPPSISKHLTKLRNEGLLEGLTVTRKGEAFVTAD